MKTREEIEQLAAREYWNSNTESRSFIKGYTQCQEDMADKKYTEDDLIKALKKYKKSAKIFISKEHPDFDYIAFEKTEDEIINSLNKQD